MTLNKAIPSQRFGHVTKQKINKQQSFKAYPLPLILSVVLCEKKSEGKDELEYQ